MSSALNAVVEAVKARTNLTKIFQRNACMKHGIPWEESKDTDGAVIVKVEQSPTAAVASTASTVAQEASTAWSWAKTLAPWIIAATGAGGGLASYLTSNAPTPPTPTDVIREVDPSSGSLLQHLEDQGRHLPSSQ